MATEYKIRVYNAAGVQTAELNDFLSLSYTKEVNAPGICELSVSGDHTMIAGLEQNSQVEVYRRNPTLGLVWTCDFYGLYRYYRYQYSDREVFTVRCPGQLSMLGWRHVMWYANVASRSKFTSAKAETIMKTLVDYNLSANATTANGRVRAGNMTGITCAADGAAGNTLDWFCTWENLLTTLQKLAQVAGGDFNLVKTAAATWEFRWYLGQLGTDRSATVIFALDRGNMAEPSYALDLINEVTVAVVGGQGEESGRATATRTGSAYNVTTNNTEVFVDARNVNTAAGLNSAGDQQLYNLTGRADFRFKVLQTPACFYGLHYFLGDKVTAAYKTAATFKIKRVTVGVEASGAETVNIELVAA